MPESDEQAYQLAFKAIGRQDPKICIFLKKGRFAGVEGDEALVEYAQDGSEILARIDRVGKDMQMAQGMCGSLSGSVPTNVGQPMIRVSQITVGGR